MGRKSGSRMVSMPNSDGTLRETVAILYNMLLAERGRKSVGTHSEINFLLFAPPPPT